MRLTRESVIAGWKVYELPNVLIGDLGMKYYVGPVGGRTIVCDYKTKAEAEAAIEMKNWLIKFLKVTK